MKKLLATAVVAVGLFSTAALADGMKGAGAYTPAPTWTGFYVGAGIGGGAVVHEVSVGPLNFNGIGGEGIFGTVSVGYDRQLNDRIVAGVFVDYDKSNISTDLSFGPFAFSLEHTHSWSVGGRLGYLLTPTTLWYGLGGWQQSEFVFHTPGPSFDLPKFSGYFIGGGVESQLGGGWSLKAEYRFSQLDGERVIGPVTFEPSLHTARMELVYKFGRRDEAPAPLK